MAVEALSSPASCRRQRGGEQRQCANRRDTAGRNCHPTRTRRAVVIRRAVLNPWNDTKSPWLLTIRGRPIRAASRLSTLKWARGPLNIRGNAAIATFFAPVLAVPPSPRTWDLANARGLIATHQRARIARGTLSVGISRCCSASAKTVNVNGPLTAGRRDPPTEAADPLCMFCMDAPQCGAAFSDLPAHV